MNLGLLLRRSIDYQREKPENYSRITAKRAQFMFSDGETKLSMEAESIEIDFTDKSYYLQEGFLILSLKDQNFKV